MAMSVPGGGGGDEDSVMSDINTTPLVDVMLVMLIIFLITIPVITHTVPVQLPNAFNQPTKTKPENINISIDVDGKVYWNQVPVPSKEALLNLVKGEAGKKPQPEIHVRADKNVRYEYVGGVILMAQRGGIQKVGFLTEPDRNAAQ